jgi:hypothetical protein
MPHHDQQNVKKNSGFSLVFIGSEFLETSKPETRKPAPRCGLNWLVSFAAGGRLGSTCQLVFSSLQGSAGICGADYPLRNVQAMYEATQKVQRWHGAVTVKERNGHMAISMKVTTTTKKRKNNSRCGAVT